MIKIAQSLVDEVCAHAHEAAPAECCGIVGGSEGRAQAVYRLRNVAADPLVAYEAAPEELFTAQRRMRSLGEELLAIYHSHPHSRDPEPSETDLRLAYYPAAIYFIVGFDGEDACLRAFRLSEREGRWTKAAYEVLDG